MPNTSHTTAPPAFTWDDPLLLDDQLTDDERMVREAAHACCQDELLPRAPRPTATSTSTARS